MLQQPKGKLKDENELYIFLIFVLRLEQMFVHQLFHIIAIYFFYHCLFLLHLFNDLFVCLSRLRGANLGFWSHLGRS